MNKVFVLLPVFNRLEFTKQCLRSFKKQTYKNFEIIVVDSDSSDGTLSYLAKYHPEVNVIRGTNDWWWTKAMQVGLKLAMKKAAIDDFILEMNNDCYFRSNYLKQLLKTAKKNGKRIVGSLCVSADNPKKVVEAGIRFDWEKSSVVGVTADFSDRFKDYQNLDLISDIDALPGKGTLIPIRVFKKIGGFEVKRLPHYIADYELTNRAKKAGFELVVDPEALIKHHEKATGQSKSFKRMWSYKEAWQLLFGRKSMNNVVDWFYFIRLSCPPSYKWRNYLILIVRIFKGLFWLFPLYYLNQSLKQGSQRFSQN